MKELNRKNGKQKEDKGEKDNQTTAESLHFSPPSKMTKDPSR